MGGAHSLRPVDTSLKRLLHSQSHFWSDSQGQPRATFPTSHVRKQAQTGSGPCSRQASGRTQASGCPAGLFCPLLGSPPPPQLQPCSPGPPLLCPQSRGESLAAVTACPTFLFPQLFQGPQGHQGVGSALKATSAEETRGHRHRGGAGPAFGAPKGPPVIL